MTAFDIENKHTQINVSYICPASQMKEEMSSDSSPTYQDPSTITHTPHPITGVIYTDVNLEKKKKGQKAVNNVDTGPTDQV